MQGQSMNYCSFQPGTNKQKRPAVKRSDKRKKNIILIFFIILIVIANYILFKKDKNPDIDPLSAQTMELNTSKK